MKVITYLGFTVLSIFLQFCVMDLIQDKRKNIDTNVKSYDLNLTSRKKDLSDLIKDISSKPHALYYRTQMAKSVKKSNLMLANVSTKMYSNSSIPLSTTDITIMDVLYDDNTSISVPEAAYTTEPFTTSAEFDNVTEITFFEKDNKSSDAVTKMPKTQLRIDCKCNFLYQVCDINCCCDIDCTDLERNMFNCNDYKKTVAKSYNCISPGRDQIYGSNLFDGLFCVIKTNLPDKRTIKTYDRNLTQKYKNWKNVENPKTSYEFRKTVYKRNDPVWLLNNGTFYYLDMATPFVNDYCNDRSAKKFLKDESVKCKVKLKDLEMFHILRTSEEARIISATENSINSSVLNCSNLHCVNWTVLSCDAQMCSHYDTNLNEASCTESVCSNLALRIDYIFHYHDSKIINATIKLHIQNISNILPFMLQEINVKFFVANKSEEQIIQFSGSPGYIEGRPVIISYLASNYTEHFFNNTSNENNHLTLPGNKKGVCSFLNVSNNVLMFGLNKRMKCRYVHTDRSFIKNNTNNVCNHIQKSINELIGLNDKVVVAPLGNPYGLPDDDWVKLRFITYPERPLYEEYNEDSSRIYCRNLITGISLMFAVASVDESMAEYKIVDASHNVIYKNASFHVEDISAVITIDISFVDVSKPSSYEYAGSPHLNIHLPSDFFFPFPSNDSDHVSSYNFQMLVILVLTHVLFLHINSNKITLA